MVSEMYQIASYTEAETVKQVVDILSKNDNAQIIAGGTDVLIKTRELKAGYTSRDLVGVTRIEEMKGICLGEEETIIIGAAMTFTAVEHHPIILDRMPSLSGAVGSVGGPQTRNAGTIGGNICNGATSADSASTLFAYQAVLTIEGTTGRRDVAIEDFYLGPGKVALEQGDVLVSINIKKEDYLGFKGHYIKFSPRNAMDIATLGCSVLLKQKDDVIEECRIAFGVAGPTPLRAVQAEAFAKGKTLDEETLHQIGRLCLESSKARDSWRGSKAFREQLIQELPKRAIKKVASGTLLSV